MDVNAVGVSVDWNGGIPFITFKLGEKKVRYADMDQETKCLVLATLHELADILKHHLANNKED